MEVHHQRAGFLGLGNNAGLNIKGLDKNDMLNYSDAMVYMKDRECRGAYERR